MQPPRRNPWFLNKKTIKRKNHETFAQRAIGCPVDKTLRAPLHLQPGNFRIDQKLPTNHSFMRVQTCLTDPLCTATLRPRIRCTRPSSSRPITVA